jgi:hypothetical protein
MYNVEGKIGGDSDLSPRGWEYAKALPDLIKKKHTPASSSSRDFQVFFSKGRNDPVCCVRCKVDVQTEVSRVPTYTTRTDE